MAMLAIGEDKSAPVKADCTVDCSGLPCPEPVRMARHAIETLRVGQVLEVIASESGAPDDIGEWAQRSGRELVAVARRSGTYVFYIRRTA